MAGELIILSPRISDAGSISGSATATDMPWSNLLNPYPHLAARTTNLTSLNFQIDLGSLLGTSGNFVHVWLGYSNFRQGQTTWRLRMDDDSDPTASPDHDSGNIFATGSASTGPGGHVKLLDWPRGVDAYYGVLLNVDIRYLRVDLIDAGHPSGYLEAARLVVAIEPTGGSFGPLNESWPVPTTAFRSPFAPLLASNGAFEQIVADGQRSDGRVLYAYERETPVEGEYVINRLDVTYRDWFRSLVRERGGARDVVVIQDPQNTDTAAGSKFNQENTVHGYLRNVSKPQRMRTSSELYQMSFDVEAIL